MRRLVKKLVEVPRNRLELLPHFARLARSIAPVLPQITSMITKEIEREFRYFTKNNKAKGHMIESRIKNARYISELTKFRVAPPIVPLRCMEACMSDLMGGNVEVLCCIMEGCGRWLKRGPGGDRVNSITEGLEKRKSNGKFDLRMNALIVNALTYINPPPPAAKVVKVRPPMERYIKHIVENCDAGGRGVSGIKNFTDRSRRLNWKDQSEKGAGNLLSRYIIKATYRGRYTAMSSIAAGMKLMMNKGYGDELKVRVVDGLLEKIQRGLEQPHFQDSMRVVAFCRMVGELMKSNVMGGNAFWDLADKLLNFGHDIPQKLREESLKEGEEEEGHRTKAEGGEGEEGEGGEDQPAAKAVGVNKYATHDPRVPTPLDPPNNFMRIKLACTLIDSAAFVLCNVKANRDKLEKYLTHLQRYLFVKPSLPADIEFMVLDLFDSLDSKTGKSARAFKRYKTWEECQDIIGKWEAVEFAKKGASNIEEEEEEEEEEDDGNDDDDEEEEVVVEDEEEGEESVEEGDEDDEDDEGSSDDESDDDFSDSDSEDEDEEELEDPKVAHARYLQKLEEEAFEQEVR